MTTMSELRTALMDTLNDLRDKENPMDVDRAKAVAQVAGVLVETAKVEVDYLKVSGGNSEFIDSEKVEKLPPGITGIRRHRIA